MTTGGHVPPPRTTRLSGRPKPKGLDGGGPFNEGVCGVTGRELVLPGRVVRRTGVRSERESKKGFRGFWGRPGRACQVCVVSSGPVGPGVSTSVLTWSGLRGLSSGRTGRRIGRTLRDPGSSPLESGGVFPLGPTPPGSEPRGREWDPVGRGTNRGPGRYRFRAGTTGRDWGPARPVGIRDGGTGLGEAQRVGTRQRSKVRNLTLPGGLLVATSHLCDLGGGVERSSRLHLGHRRRTSLGTAGVLVRSVAGHTDTLRVRDGLHE